MSGAAQDWARRQATGSPVRKAVLLALANYADKATAATWVSQEQIAHDTEFSPRAVRTAHADLERLGFISRTKRHHPVTKRRANDHIVLNIANPPAGDATGSARKPPAGDAAGNDPGHRHVPPDPPAGDAGIKNIEEPSREPEEAATARLKANELEAWLRGLVGQEPVLLSQDIDLVTALLDDDVMTRADLEAGIRAALNNADFRPRYWKQLVGWIRRAAQERLAGKPRSHAITLPAAGLTEVQWRSACLTWKQTGGQWSHHRHSPPPDDPTHRIPLHILAEVGIAQGAAR